MKRAYGSEPVLLATSPVTTPAWTQQKKDGLSSGEKIAIVVATLLLCIAGGLIIWLVQGRNETASPIPPTVRQTVTFPIVEPRSLPAGFTVDATSFQPTATLLTFAISYENGKALVVSQQPVPANLNFEDFYEQFENRKDVMLSNGGKAVIGRFEDTDLASVVKDNTWVLIRAPDGIDKATLEAVVQGFGENR